MKEESTKWSSTVSRADFPHIPQIWWDEVVAWGDMTGVPKSVAVKMILTLPSAPEGIFDDDSFMGAVVLDAKSAGLATPAEFKPALVELTQLVAKLPDDAWGSMAEVMVWLTRIHAKRASAESGMPEALVMMMLLSAMTRKKGEGESAPEPSASSPESSDEKNPSPKSVTVPYTGKA